MKTRIFHFIMGLATLGITIFFSLPLSKLNSKEKLLFLLCIITGLWLIRDSIYLSEKENQDTWMD